MRKLSVLFFLLAFSSYLLAQSKISGKIFTEEKLDLDNVLIINMKTNEKTYSDNLGNFQISASVNDEIRLVRANYDRVSFVVKESDFSKNLDFQMNRTENQIAEVEIVSKGQLDRLKRNIGVPEAKEIKPKTEKDVPTWGKTLLPVLLGNLNIQSMKDLISGDARRKRNLYRYEENQRNIERVKSLVGEEFIIEKGIPKERIIEFLGFSISQRPELKNLMKTVTNRSRIELILSATAQVYLDRLKETQK